MRGYPLITNAGLVQAEGCASGFVMSVTDLANPQDSDAPLLVTKQERDRPATYAELAGAEVWVEDVSSDPVLRFDLGRQCVVSALEIWNATGMDGSGNPLAIDHLGVSYSAACANPVLADAALVGVFPLEADQPTRIEFEEVAARYVFLHDMTPPNATTPMIGLSQVWFHGRPSVAGRIFNGTTGQNYAEGSSGRYYFCDQFGGHEASKNYWASMLTRDPSDYLKVMQYLYSGNRYIDFMDGSHCGNCDGGNPCQFIGEPKCVGELEDRFVVVDPFNQVCAVTEVCVACGMIDSDTIRKPRANQIESGGVDQMFGINSANAHHGTATDTLWVRSASAEECAPRARTWRGDLMGIPPFARFAMVTDINGHTILPASYGWQISRCQMPNTNGTGSSPLWSYAGGFHQMDIEMWPEDPLTGVTRIAASFDGLVPGQPNRVLTVFNIAGDGHGSDLTQDYHTYRIFYHPQVAQMYVDDNLVLEWVGHRLDPGTAPPRPYFNHEPVGFLHSGCVSLWRGPDYYTGQAGRKQDIFAMDYFGFLPVGQDLETYFEDQ